MPSLFVIQGRDQGKRFELKGPKVSIGRDKSNDVQLHDSEISRNHSELIVNGNLYELVDLVLHPSRWDALPQAVLEAMALGKPVAASAATGNAEIIRDGVDGLLVAPTDRDAWASAIDLLLGDAPLAARLGAEAKRRAREDFRFDVTVERTLALYRDVIRLARSEP